MINTNNNKVINNKLKIRINHFMNKIPDRIKVLEVLVFQLRSGTQEI